MRTSHTDIVGHGTHVAGTIAAKIGARAKRSIHGICKCHLLVWKIFSDDPIYVEELGQFVYVVNEEMYLQALRECILRRVQVVNLSIGGKAEPPPPEMGAFIALKNRGAIVVAAMGNERARGSPKSYPAAVPGVIAVGATDRADSVAPFSSSGDHIAVTAPGDMVWSTLPTYSGQSGFRARRTKKGTIPDKRNAFVRERKYAAWPGTSMSAPHVSAAAALYLAKKGNANPAEVVRRLQETADKVVGMKGSSFTTDYGAGRLNLYRLLQ